MLVKEGLKYDAGLFGEAQTSMPVQLHVEHYSNGCIALQLYSEMEDLPGHFEPFITCTVNVHADCPRNEVWVKGYAESEGLPEWLQRNGIIEPGPTDNAQLGYAFCERFKLTAEFIALVAQKLDDAAGRSHR